MSASAQSRPKAPGIAAALIMIAFIIVGLGYVLLAYTFGVGTGLFGVKNVWDSGNTILLFSGLALILSGITSLT